MPATDSTPSASASRSRDFARRIGVAGFWRWWAQELWSLLPERARAVLTRRRTRPVLAFDGQVATLWQPRSNGRLKMVETARIALDADAATVGAAGRAALANLVRAGASAPQVVVALPARSALRKMLALPAAIEENLRQALAYDLDRHTPFRADELYFDAAVVDRDAARNAVEVELVAARRSVVDPLLRRAEDFGAEVTAVTIDPPERAAWSRINLLPDDRRAPPSTWARWQVIVPAAVLVLLVLAALILPVWQKRDGAIALIGVSEQARHRAEASDALRSELERKVGDYNFALRRKYAYPGTVQVLNDVTRILPDDTWLTQFEFHTSRGKDVARTIALRGESANAGRLVTLLEDSKRFTQAAPRSPTTKIQPGPGEIFDVGAQVEPFAAPAPKPLDLTAPPPVRPRPPTSVTTPTAPTLAPAASASAKGAAAAKPAAEAAPAGGALAPATAQPRDEPVVAPAAQTAQPGQEPAPPATQPAPQVAPSAPSQFGPLPPTDPNAVIRPRNQR